MWASVIQMHKPCVKKVFMFWSKDGNRDICVRRCPHMKYFVLQYQSIEVHIQSIFHYKNKLISLPRSLFGKEQTHVRPCYSSLY